MDPQSFWKEFDLAALNYEQFLNFFFARPVVEFEKQYDLFREGIDYFVASQSAVLISHLQSMCRINFVDVTARYTHQQIDQGLSAIFGAGIACERILFDPAVDRALRIECIEAMYLPFRDVVVRFKGDIRETFYWMWWDMLGYTFWGAARASDYYFDLNEDQRALGDAIYQTLVKILALDHLGCQICALHGLGHLKHPWVRVTVQQYLDQHRHELSDEEVLWVERCRFGRIA